MSEPIPRFRAYHLALPLDEHDARRLERFIVDLVRATRAGEMPLSSSVIRDPRGATGYLLRVSTELPTNATLSP